MITLQSLTQLPDGRFYAKWFDSDDVCGLGHTIAALHHADGRLDAANFNIRAPRLTAEQMATAQPERSPAQELAAKGTAVRPDWANRYDKAVQLIDAGKVRLVSEKTAVVTSSEPYEITGQRCGCKWQMHNPGDPCSHIIAARMARALGQPFVPYTAAEIAELNRRDNRRSTDSHQAHVAGRGENIAERNRRQARQDGDGARMWIRMAQANGRGTIPAHIWNRAAGVGGD